MLRVGIVGIGFMGRGHLDAYQRLEKEGKPVQLVAVCDIDPKKFTDFAVKGNIDVGGGHYDFSKYNLYTDLDEMLKKEQLDYVDIALPTYLHAEASVKALRAGFNVLCEKPMALNTRECQSMIDAAKETGKTLMIAQCLRFWPAYEEAKAIIDEKRYGDVISAYFFRGGGTPIWSYQNWLLHKDKAGGALLDQHIHDVDTLHWFFGMPQRVSSLGKTVIEGSWYDAVSTNYVYPDGKVVNAQDDWTINGNGFGFEMIFRINMEKGAMTLTRDGFTVYPNEGEAFKPELPADDGYYREIVHFYEAIQAGVKITRCTPESTRDTIRIAEAELRSADHQGKLEDV